MAKLNFILNHIFIMNIYKNKINLSKLQRQSININSLDLKAQFQNFIKMDLYSKVKNSQTTFNQSLKQSDQQCMDFSIIQGQNSTLKYAENHEYHLKEEIKDNHTENQSDKVIEIERKGKIYFVDYSSVDKFQSSIQQLFQQSLLPQNLKIPLKIVILERLSKLDILFYAQLLETMEIYIQRSFKKVF